MNYIQYLEGGNAVHNTISNNYNLDSLDVRFLRHNPHSSRMTTNFKNLTYDLIHSIQNIFKTPVHPYNQTGSFGTATIENGIGKLTAPGYSNSLDDYRITGATVDDIGTAVHLKPRS